MLLATFVVRQVRTSSLIFGKGRPARLVVSFFIYFLCCVCNRDYRDLVVRFAVFWLLVAVGDILIFVFCSSMVFRILCRPPVAVLDKTAGLLVCSKGLLHRLVVIWFSFFMFYV